MAGASSARLVESLPLNNGRPHASFHSMATDDMIQPLLRALSERERAALVTLLADEDPAVYRTIRARILACGPEAREWLRGYRLDNDPRLRRRVMEIVEHFGRREADNCFLGFCLRHGEDLDLEEGCWLLARTRYPEINVTAYHALLDEFADTLREKVSPSDEPQSVIATINELLFSRLGFVGDEQNYYDPENSYLNRVLDRRSGNPLLMCTVYLGVARRLRLPIAGIGLPGHFLCRYQTPVRELYIDAFGGGRILTKADCVKYLQQTGYEFHEAFLVPASPRRMLLRMCSNLHQISARLNDREVAAAMYGYVIALSK
ncbi:MAG: hypothetical protein EXS29_02070 [Pedosphaera sp.]|nr:hypothetical protein [Pedosphaera sp.]